MVRLNYKMNQEQGGEVVVVERGSTNNKDTDCNHRKLWMAEGKIHRFENSKTPE